MAQLVHQKTAGNPFFAIQFVSSLAEEGLLTFDHAKSQWHWDLNRIHAKGYTDNVVDLMVRKLNRLPAETQKALQQLACLGSSAEFALLTMAYQDSKQEMHRKLWEAVRTGLVFRSENSYKFLHDRVQEAAYSLIPEELRAEVHLRIGRLLAAHTPPERRDETIFELVNQLNRGAALITSRGEREQLAELNLIAGKRAKASTAYASALKYLVAGAALLVDGSWERRHDLVFPLELQRAECEFLTGALEVAEERLAALATQAASTVERATASCLRIDVYTTLGQSDRAVTVCLDYLRHVGVNWSPHPTEEEMRHEYERIWAQLGSRTIEELVELPLMTDPASLASLDVLTKVFPAALYTDANLYALVICRAVNLSLEWGNCDGSCVAYVRLGMVAGPRFGHYETGFRFGQLGLELVEQRGLTRFQARTLETFGLIMPWTRPVRAGRDLLRRAFEVATQTGDLTVAAYSCDIMNTNLLVAGDPLVEAQREAELGLAFAQRARFSPNIDVITAQLALIRTLRGLTRTFGCFEDGQFDELKFELHVSSNPALALPECYYWIRKLQARFFAGDYASAIEASSRAQRVLWTSLSQFETAEFHFYGALSHAASWDSAAPDRRQGHFDALTTHHRQLEVWAENCSENFENRAALVGAEIARLEGRDLDAMHLYEKALHSAHASGFVHNEALVNELAARFYMPRGFDKIANTYLRDARDCYLQWGADGKVRQLEKQYPHLTYEKPLPDPTSTILTSVEHLDLATVIKLSQAISGEIVLEKLIDTIMRTAIEHAGAERGLLILARGDEYRIVAEATTSSDTVAVGPRQGSVNAADLPLSVLYYVVRKKESVLLHDAVGDKQFFADDYIQGHHARSILCLPLLKEGRLLGLLYLENNLATHVFTPERIVVLKLLASEAAISLENIRLYDDLQESERRYREMQMELAHANRVAAMGQLTASIAHEVNQPNTAVVASAQAALRWLDRRPPELEQVRRALARIEQNAIRASEVIERIRDMIKKTPPRKDRVAINRVLHEVIELTRAEAARHRVLVQTAFAENLPEVVGDRVELQQVTVNLILNAIEAMSETDQGSRELLIRTAKADGDDILVAVVDSGPGLPATLERLFDPFYTTKPSGLGVGLSICRSIIVAHAGRLWASANVPRGAVFQFTLPTKGEDPNHIEAL